ncbi:MAG: AtpZ/AtpI family protein [Anaerolineales bacterium]
MTQPEQKDRSTINTVLVVMIGQVGCLTLAILLASVLGGLWLDNRFGTKPILTVTLLLAGIPVSVILMIVVARKTLAKLKSRSASEKEV